MTYGYNNYGNPYQQQSQMRFSPIKIYPVSNIMEANATPVDSLEPVFFYNKAENVIYKKQIDGTGAAPIQIYKLQIVEQTEQPDPFKSINDRLDGLYKLLQPKEEETKGKK